MPTVDFLWAPQLCGVESVERMRKACLPPLLGHSGQDRKPGEPFTRKSDTEVERERMMRDMDAKSEKYYAEVIISVLLGHLCECVRRTCARMYSL